MRRWLLVTYDHINARPRSHIDELRMAQSVIADTSANAGDDVLLWRYGQGGGLVAAGRITETVHPQESRQSLRMHQNSSKIRTNDDLMLASIEFRKLFLDAPVSPDVLYHKGLISIWYVARDLAGRMENNGFDKLGELAPVELSEEDFRDVISVASKERSIEWPATWNIPAGSVVRRSQLHSLLGGNPRVSCGSSAKTPNMFLFLSRGNDSDELTPYWDCDVLVAPGHFQWDTDISQENIALLNHAWRGRPLRVFESSIDDACYLGQFVIDDANPVEGWKFTGEERELRMRASKTRPTKKRQVPLVRMRRLNGVEWPFDNDPFEESRRVELGLRLTVSQNYQEDSSRQNQTGDAISQHETELSETIQHALTRLERDPEVSQTIGGMDEAQAFAALVQHIRRQSDISSLRSAVEDPTTTEHDLQKYLDRMTWIFGGEFITRAKRRALTVQDELDISLVRPDGTLHGVEIKKAYIPTLIKKQRNHLIVGRDINEAVGQAMNYLRGLDEQYHRILVDFGIDCRRANMTVLIGYAPFADAQVDISEIDEAIRTYNSHMARIRVMTYDQLLDAAQRVLDLTEPSTKSDPGGD